MVLLRVLFDANVWVSAFLHRQSVPGRATALARAGLVQSVISEPLIAQVRRALLRLGYGPIEIDEAESEMRAGSELVHPTFRLAVIAAKDSDNRALECAVAGQADAVVTGDRKHLLPLGSYQGIPILSPADFLRSLGR